MLGTALGRVFPRNQFFAKPTPHWQGGEGRTISLSTRIAF
jgi:hypothetical protein